MSSTQISSKSQGENYSTKCVKETVREKKCCFRCVFQWVQHFYYNDVRLNRKRMAPILKTPECFQSHSRTSASTDSPAPNQSVSTCFPKSKSFFLFNSVVFLFCLITSIKIVFFLLLFIENTVYFYSLRDFLVA